MASYVKRGDGYQVRWRETPGGPQRYRTVSTAREAKALAATLDADMARGTYVPPDAGKVSLVDAMSSFIDQQPWRHNTMVNARNAVEHARAHFGDRPIGTIRTSDLQAFVTSLDLEPRTVETIFSYVRKALRAAYHDGWLGRDPSARVKLPRFDGAPIVVPTVAEVAALIDGAPADYAIAVTIGAGLGLRASEACGLTLDHVDFLRREVTVDRQWHGQLDRFEPPKSKASNRTIPASDRVLAALSTHLAEHGAGEHGVIVHADGRPLNANRMAWRWELTADAAGSSLTFHALRHHYASSLISAGCSIVAVQHALGHSKPSITLDTYGHLMPSDTDRIRTAIDQAWNAECVLSASDLPASR